MRALVWLVVAVLAYILGVVCLELGASAQRGDPHLGWYVTLELVGFALWVFCLVALIIAIVDVGRALMVLRRKKGLLTRSERRDRARQEEDQRILAEARRICAMLSNRQVPSAIAVWDVVALPGEVFFCRLPLSYARYYGMDVSYQTEGGAFLGHPVFVAAGIVATSVANNAARRSAEAQAREQWREWQVAPTLVSNRRILCQASGGWVEFPYESMSALYPDLESRTLVIGFHQGMPLLLRGSGVLIATPLAILFTGGPAAFAAHPALDLLRH